MKDRRILAFAVLAVAAILLVCMPFDSDGKAAERQTGPEEDFPDADYILTPAKNSQVRITYRAPSEEDPSVLVWTDRFINAGSDLYLVKWTDLDDDLKVVYDGAVMDDFSLIGVDDASHTQKFVNIDFTMVSGSIGCLRLTEMFSGEVSRLGDDYENMFNPIANAHVRLDSGHVKCFEPTSDMVYVDNLEVSVGTGMTVDRFHTSGENGRYGNVYVGLRGGSVGYMANIQSRVGTLTYELDSGAVDYFCIGADTEHSGNVYLKDASTSFVSGDVDVYIDGSVQIRRAIVGGGVTEIPNILWNGDRIQDAVVRNMAIEAPEHTILLDGCFFDDQREKVLGFKYYTFGGTAKKFEMSSETRLANGIPKPVYGPDGVWNGCSDIDVNTGTSIFLNTTTVLCEEGEIRVVMGGKMVLTNRTVLYGSLDAVGEVVNNNIIELRGDGHVTGKVIGNGLVADQIVSQSPESTIVVMSELDTVIVDPGDSRMLTELTSKFLSGKTKVTVRASYEGMGFTGESFLLSLREMSVSDLYETGYQLLIHGIERNTLKACQIDVTVPFTVPEGKTAKVFLFDNDKKSYQEMRIVDSSGGHITFRTDSIGQFSIALSDGEAPAPEPPRKDDTGEVIVLVIGIAVVSAAMVYTFFRLRR